jgi:hypothetical protein
MSRRGLIIGGLAAIVIALLAVWIIDNTTWEQIPIPTPLRGDAAEDPFYAAKALVRELGGATSAASYFIPPPPDDVVYLSSWNWNLGAARRRLLEQWVESGGRLVMDESVYFHGEQFTAWNGIGFRFLEPAAGAEGEPGREDGNPRYEECRLLNRQGQSVLPDERPDHGYLVCHWNARLGLTSNRAAQWQLRDDRGVRAIRVAVGRGSVTVIRATPFWWRSLLDEDHAELFVAMTQLRRGDRVHFLSEDDHPSLPVLVWRHGWPALLAALLALALALWRAGMRFGPLLPASAPVRRSLVEQIRGTGRFVLRQGAGGALHRACVRALENAARGSIAGFDAMQGRERASAIAAATGLDPDAVAEAIDTPASASPRIFVAAIMQVESIRRRILSHKPRRTHGS